MDSATFASWLQKYISYEVKRLFQIEAEKAKQEQKRLDHYNGKKLDTQKIDYKKLQEKYAKLMRAFNEQKNQKETDTKR